MFASLLLASTFLEDMGAKLFVMVLVIFWLAAKFLKSNSTVKDAAKKAAAKKAIDIVGKWLK